MVDEIWAYERYIGSTKFNMGFSLKWRTEHHVMVWIDKAYHVKSKIGSNIGTLYSWIFVRLWLDFVSLCYIYNSSIR